LRAIHSLFGLAEGPWRWLVGLQSGLAMAIPLAVFVAAGRPSLGIIAALGAFLAPYGSRLAPGARVPSLLAVGVGLVAAAGAGVLVSDGGWDTVACLTLVAAVAAPLTIGTGLGPPGPTMFLLVAGVAGQAAQGGTLGSWQVPGLVALGAGVAWLVVVLTTVAALASGGGGPRRALAAMTRPAGSLRPDFRLDRRAIALSLRVVVAVALAASAGVLVGTPHPWWVVVVAVGLLQTDMARRPTVGRAAHRITGTLVGVAPFALIVAWRPGGAWLVAVIALLQGAAEAVITRNYALGMVFLTPLALTLVETVRPTPAGQVIAERLVDTVIGALVGLVVFEASEWLWRRSAVGRA
jgi:hypothetical protein